ncbi:MAG: ABC transporter ATP-binding protein [Planctomycetes bacterium]|nr:ABC transporter ATP-binding protein [Planctomycetota bacterium]
MSAVIETRELTVRFKKTDVLRDLSLDFERGSVTAMLGRNGVGKSTLLRVLVGFLPATSGRASVFGLDAWKRGPDVRRLTGYVPDRLELPRWMSVDDHLRFLEAFYPTWDRDEERRLLKQLDLDAKAKVKDLSKGQREKHALIAALAHRPELLLLDEPFSGLDPVVRQEVLTAVLGHLRDDGRTIVVVTHSMLDVERLADRIVLLEDGRVRLDGEAEELKRRVRRVAITLCDGAPLGWTPPGAPTVERSGEDVVLSYLDWDDSIATRLHADPAVRHVASLPTGLDDLFRVAARREGAPCAV